MITENKLTDKQKIMVQCHLEEFKGLYDNLLHRYDAEKQWRMVAVGVAAVITGPLIANFGEHKYFLLLIVSAIYLAMAALRHVDICYRILLGRYIDEVLSKELSELIEYNVLQIERKIREEYRVGSIWVFRDLFCAVSQKPGQDRGRKCCGSS